MSEFLTLYLRQVDQGDQADRLDLVDQGDPWLQELQFAPSHPVQNNISNKIHTYVEGHLTYMPPPLVSSSDNIILGKNTVCVHACVCVCICIWGRHACTDWRALACSLRGKCTQCPNLFLPVCSSPVFLFSQVAQWGLSSLALLALLLVPVHPGGWARLRSNLFK